MLTKVYESIDEKSSHNNIKISSFVANSKKERLKKLFFYEKL